MFLLFFLVSTLSANQNRNVPLQIMQNFGLVLEIPEASGISPFYVSKDRPDTDGWNSLDEEAGFRIDVFKP